MFYLFKTHQHQATVSASLLCSQFIFVDSTFGCTSIFFCFFFLFFPLWCVSLVFWLKKKSFKLIGHTITITILSIIMFVVELYFSQPHDKLSWQVIILIWVVIKILPLAMISMFKQIVGVCFLFFLLLCFCECIWPKRPASVIISLMFFFFVLFRNCERFSHLCHPLLYTSYCLCMSIIFVCHLSYAIICFVLLSFQFFFFHQICGQMLLIVIACEVC